MRRGAEKFAAALAVALGGALGCPAPSAGPPPAVSTCPDARPVGHHALHVGPDHRTWYFAADAPVAVFAPRSGPATATWQGVDSTSVSLSATGTSTLSDGARRVFRPPPVAGTLAYCGHRFAVERRPPPGAWPRVQEAGTATAALARIVTAPTHALEAQAAALGLARAASKAAPAGEASGYERAQIARGERALQDGLLVDAATAFSSAAWVARRRRAFPAAEALLRRAQAAADGAGDDLSEARVQLQRGYLDREMGRFRQARAALRAGRAASARQGDTGLEAYFALAEAGTLALVGQYDEALALLEGVAPLVAGTPAARLDHAIDRTYTEAHAMASGHLPEDWPTVQRHLQEASKLAARLQDRSRQASLLVNLAWVADRQGDDALAAESLARYHALEIDAYAAREVALFEARRRLSQDPAAALAALARLREAVAAESGGLPTDLGWRVDFARARALAAIGRADDARATYAAALDGLEAASAHTTLRAARAPFLDARAELFDAAAAHALAQGEPGRAFVLTERAKAQVLDALRLRDRVESLDDEARERWLAARDAFGAARDALGRRPDARRAVPGAELAAFDAETRRLEVDARTHWERLYTETAPARPRRRLTALEPLQARLREDDRLVAFAWVGERRMRFELTRRALTLQPHDAQVRLDGAAHIYLVPAAGDAPERLLARWGPALLPEASVSVLPLAGWLLEDRAGPAGPALVVGDPSRDLPAARAEARWVAEHLGARARLGASVRRAEVVADLADAGLFHFAGHGTLAPSDPWSAALRLADGEALRLEDLLARPVAPRLAVLSGCRTGRAGALGRRFRVGLPEAFLLGGTRNVLATTRDVDDRATRAFVEAFYRAGGAEDPVGAYGEVVRRSIREKKKDWDAFYILGVRT